MHPDECSSECWQIIFFENVRRNVFGNCFDQTFFDDFLYGVINKARRDTARFAIDREAEDFARIFSKERAMCVDR